MSEADHICDDRCIYFAALSPEQKIENARIRAAAEKGQEPPGLYKTLCGGCIKERGINAALEEKIEKLLHPDN